MKPNQSLFGPVLSFMFILVAFYHYSLESPFQRQQGSERVGKQNNL